MVFFKDALFPRSKSLGIGGVKLVRLSRGRQRSVGDGIREGLKDALAANWVLL